MKIKYYIIAKENDKTYYIEEKNNHFYLTKNKNEATIFVGDIISDKYQSKTSVFSYLKNKNKNLEFGTEVVANF